MMKKTGILLVLVLISFNACKKSGEEPGYSGEILLSSELLQSGQDYIFYGFSFETGQISTYSYASGTRPDLTVNHIIMQDVITSIYLEGSDDSHAFYENGTFADAAEAEAYFDDYREVSAQDFVPLAQDIRENQVWTVQTADKKFAKIWIREITYQSGSLSDFAVVKIRYEYQPDGSGLFN